MPQYDSAECLCNSQTTTELFASSSVAIVMADVFFNNDANPLRKFTKKIVQIFDKTNNPKGQGIIQGTQSFLDFIFELLKNDWNS